MACTVAARSGLAILTLLVQLAVLAVPGAPAALAQSEADPKRPREHFTVLRPAGLSGADAERIYARLKRDLAAAYGLSGQAYARDYLNWRRYNRVPYRSAQHGERFVNNYANRAALGYRLFEGSGPMPPGAILVKDSFAVTEAGAVFPGPVFVMEKMPAGFNAESGDWRYTMIMPNGAVFGTTNGRGSDKVAFCIDCHISVAPDQDSVMLLPEEYRTR